MKTCLKCMTTTLDDETEKCRICGANEFRSGRPKTGYKMEEDELNKDEKQEEDNKGTGEQILGSELPEYNYDTNDDIKVSKWMVTFIIMSIPIVNVIYAIVNILMKNGNNSYISYMKATVIMNIIAILVSFVAGALFSELITNLIYTLY